MLKNKSLICLSFIVILLESLVVVSCSTKSDLIDPTKYPDMVDHSWLSGEPCLAPCWQRLELGRSMRQDAVAIVRNLAFIQAQDSVISEKSEAFLCRTPSSVETCVVMGFNENILSHLELSINYPLTLEQVVERIGEPDGFYASMDAEGSICTIDVFWPASKIRVSISRSNSPPICDSMNSKKGKFPKSIQVNYIYYSLPGEIENYIKGIQNSGELYKHWEGFEK